MNQERYIPAPLYECLRFINARHENLSPAERRELMESAALLELAYPALRELAHRIEKCGASLELTQAVTLCCDLASAIGNKWNPRDKNREQMVRDALPKETA